MKQWKAERKAEERVQAESDAAQAQKLRDEPPENEGVSQATGGNTIEYVDFDLFERRQQELKKHRPTNHDSATERAISNIERTEGSTTDTDALTPFERENLRYSGGENFRQPPDE